MASYADGLVIRRVQIVVVVGVYPGQASPRKGPWRSIPVGVATCTPMVTVGVDEALGVAALHRPAVTAR